MAWEIYTFGGGQYLHTVFNGIAGLTAGSNYLSIVAIMAMVGLTWSMLESSFGPSFKPNVTWLVSFFLFYNVMFYPKVEVLIHDDLDVGHRYEKIEHVPFALGVFASLTSQVGYEITKNMEMAFSRPDYLPYHKYGFLFGSRLLDMTSSAKITDSDFAESINDFLQQCLMLDLDQKLYSLNGLKEAEDLWGFLKEKASKAKGFSIKYKGVRQIKTCADGIKELDEQWDAQVNKTAGIFGKVFGTKEDSKSILLNNMPASYDDLKKVSKNAAEVMKQSMLIHEIDRAAADRASKGNVYATARANIQTKMAFETSKRQAQEWVPILRIVFEVIFYGIFPLVFLLFLLPIGPQVARGYFAAFVWLQAWGSLYAILNLVISGYIDDRMSVFDGHGASIVTQAGMAAIHHNAAEIAGYISWFIPFLAAGIARGAHAVTGLSTSMLAIPQSAASTAASEAASGNISLGNFNMDNASYGNSSANKINNSAYFDSGRVQAVNSAGGMTTVNEDGRAVYDQTGSVSRFPNVQLSSNDSEVNSYMQSASRLESMGQNLSMQSANAKAKSIDQLSQSMYNHSINQNNGLRFTEHASQETRDAYSRIQQVAEEVSRTQGVDVSKAFDMVFKGNISGSLSGGTAGGSGLSVGIGADASGALSSRVNNSQTYNKTERDFNYDQLATDINTVTSAVKDRSIELSDTSGRSLNESFNQNYSESQRLEDQSRVYMDEARNFSEQAQFAKSRSVSFTQDRTPEIIESAKSQLSPYGTPLGERVLNIVANDPAKTARLKDEFMSAHGGNQLHDSFKSNQSALGVHTGSKLGSDYASAASSIGNDIGSHDNTAARTDFLSHTEGSHINNQDLVTKTDQKVSAVNPGVNQMPISDIKHQVQEKLDGNIVMTNLKSTFGNE